MTNEQLKCACLPAAYNERELSSCTKRPLTQMLESLAPKLTPSCYLKNGRRVFKHSSLAAAFCVSGLVSATRKPPDRCMPSGRQVHWLSVCSKDMVNHIFQKRLREHSGFAELMMRFVFIRKVIKRKFLIIKIICKKVY